MSWQATVCSAESLCMTAGDRCWPPECRSGCAAPHEVAGGVAVASRNMCGRSSSRGMPLVWLIHSSTSRTPCIECQS